MVTPVFSAPTCFTAALLSHSNYYSNWSNGSYSCINKCRRDSSAFLYWLNDLPPHNSPLARGGEGVSSAHREHPFRGADVFQESLYGTEGYYLQIKCQTSSYLPLDEISPASCLTMETFYGLKTLGSFLDHHDRLTVKSFTMV